MYPSFCCLHQAAFTLNKQDLAGQQLEQPGWPPTSALHTSQTSPAPLGEALG